MSRRTKIALAALLAGALLAGATAFAFGGYGGRHGFGKRVVTAMIDDALDEAQVTPEQRERIYAARDRVFAAFEAHRAQHGPLLEEALRLFESDRLDLAQIEALHRQREAERQKIADVMHQALVDVHDTLTPEQRKVVADYVRSIRSHHWR